LNLSKNFTLKELTASQVAIRNCLDNTPDAKAIANLKTLVETILQPLRDHYGRSVKVSSGYRSLELNRFVGGSTNSDHCKGQAADIEISGISNGDLAKYIAENFKFTQVILEFYTQGIPDSGWVHISYDTNNLKCETLTASIINKKTVYLQGFAI
jgi:hypothetical protein